MSLSKAVYDVLRYFHFFQHGLSSEEVRDFCSVPASLEEVERELQAQVASGRAHRADKYYAIAPESNLQRTQNLGRNRRMLRIAQWMGWMMMRFPFIRGVYVSGSLAKSGVSGAADDIDYFIVTASNRVWTAKFLLTLFKKLFLFNSKKYFCINFFRDENHLDFHKKNIYVATEIITLIPLQNRRLLHELWGQNPWIFEFFPNRERVEVSRKLRQTAKSLPERIWDLLWGNRFESWAHAQYSRHFEQKNTENPNRYVEKSRNSAAYFPNSMEGQVLGYYY